MAVIPSGTAEPWQWAKREADANDALTRLFHQLMMQREARLSNEAFRAKEGRLDRASALERTEISADASTYNAGLRSAPPQIQPNNSGYSFRGTGGGGSTAPAAAVKTIPGSTAPVSGPPIGSFQKTSAVADPNQKLAMINALFNNTQASGQGTSGATDFSAQSRRPPESSQARPKAGVGGATGTTLKTLPKKPKLQADFADIPDEVLKAWDAIEQKYGLPRGLMLTIVGFETSGGKQVNTTRRAGNSAIGPFQINDATGDQFKASVADRLHPIKAAEIAARNMVMGNEQYKKSFPNDPKLGTSFNDIVHWTMLQQFGVGDGPGFVHAGRTNANAPATLSMRPNIKGRDGKERDKGLVLAQNGVPSTASVKQLYDAQYAKVNPWATKMARYPYYSGQVSDDSDGDGQTPAPYAINRPQPSTPGSSGRVRGISTRRLVPRMQEIAQRLQDEYPEVRFTSGHRTDEHNRDVGGAENSQHLYGTAFDVDLGGLDDDDKKGVLRLLRSMGVMRFGNYPGKSPNVVHGDIAGKVPTAWGKNYRSNTYGGTAKWFREEIDKHLRREPVQYTQRYAQDPDDVETSVAPDVELPSVRPNKVDTSQQFQPTDTYRQPLGVANLFSSQKGVPLVKPPADTGPQAPPMEARASEYDIDAQSRPMPTFNTSESIAPPARARPQDYNAPPQQEPAPPVPVAQEPKPPTPYDTLVADADRLEKEKAARTAAEWEATKARAREAAPARLNTYAVGGSAPMPQSAIAGNVASAAKAIASGASTTVQTIEDAALAAAGYAAPIIAKLNVDKPKGPKRDLRLGGRQTDREVIEAIYNADKNAGVPPTAIAEAPTDTPAAVPPITPPPLTAPLKPTNITPPEQAPMPSRNVMLQAIYNFFGSGKSEATAGTGKRLPGAPVPIRTIRIDPNAPVEEELPPYTADQIKKMDEYGQTARPDPYAASKDIAAGGGSSGAANVTPSPSTVPPINPNAAPPSGAPRVIMRLKPDGTPDYDFETPIVAQP